jgi:hypothetical protein
MRRTIRLGAWLAGAVVLVLAVLQVILPRLAASRISSRVGRYGSVHSVTVTAWPAVELLWGHADSVRVSAGSVVLSPTQAAKLVWEAHDTASMDVSAESARVGPLRLSRASLRKRGDALTAVAYATQADVTAALPDGFGVRLLRSGNGEVEVRATGGLFGIGASVNALAGASRGDLVAHPLGFLLEGLQLKLFSDPHVYVEGVGATLSAGAPPIYRLTMRATLR